VRLRAVALCAFAATFISAGIGLLLVDPETGQLRWVERAAANQQGGWLFVLAALPVATPLLLDALTTKKEAEILTRLAGAAISVLLVALAFAWFWPDQKWPWILVLLGGAVGAAVAISRVKDVPAPHQRTGIRALAPLIAILLAAATTAAVPLAVAAVIQAINAARAS
jgi:hypothetical protein